FRRHHYVLRRHLEMDQTVGPDPGGSADPAPALACDATARVLGNRRHRLHHKFGWGLYGLGNRGLGGSRAFLHRSSDPISARSPPRINPALGSDDPLLRMRRRSFRSMAGVQRELEFPTPALPRPARQRI